MAVNIAAPQTEPAYLVERIPVQETLRRCLTDESVKCAFLAKQRLRGSKKVLAIVAKHPRDGEQMPSLPRPVRDAIRSAITYGQLAFCVLLDQHGNRHHADALLAMPITLVSGEVWGALVTVGRSPSTQIRSIPLVRELAEQLAHILSDFQLEHALPIRRSGDDGSFLASRDVLAHELRVPLCAAAYALDALTQSCAVGHNGNDTWLLHTARSGVLEAQRILRWDAQLRALARDPTASTIGPTSINDALNHALLLLPYIAPYVRVGALEELPRVSADSVWLTQVFTNLLENAIKHATPPAYVQVTATLIAPDRVRISIISPHTGVTADERHTLFRPYARKERSHDLTSQGLGLSIARYLVTAMGGDITIASDGQSHTALHLTFVTAPNEPQ
jgi:signal transduction histidine kinase